VRLPLWFDHHEQHKIHLALLPYGRPPVTCLNLSGHSLRTLSGLVAENRQRSSPRLLLPMKNFYILCYIKYKVIH
jgi:hypothetical protein